MTQAKDDARPPSGSYAETFRRHRVLCCLPIALGALVAAIFLFTAPTSYRSTASIWVDTAAPVASSVGADGSPSLTEPPASSEQGILNELLTTGSFVGAVAQHSLLANSLKTPAAIRAGAPRLVAHGHTTSAATGGQILNVSYTGSTRAVTESVLGSVVDQLRDYNNAFATQHAQAAVAYDREQVKLAQAVLTAADHDVGAYVAAHPKANRSDPGYVALTTAQNNAVTELGQANATLNQTSGSRGSDGWTIRVVDPPGPATSQGPDKKKIAGLLLGGAFAGLLVSLLAVVGLTPARAPAPVRDAVTTADPADERELRSDREEAREDLVPATKAARDDKKVAVAKTRRASTAADRASRASSGRQSPKHGRSTKPARRRTTVGALSDQMDEL